jgi:hypothetical protein
LMVSARRGTTAIQIHSRDESNFIRGLITTL